MVAKVADVSITPRAFEVVMRRGADRFLQREGTGFRCSAGMMGLPWGDRAPAGDAIPRAGLEWMPLPLENNNWFIDGVRVDAVCIACRLRPFRFSTRSIG